VASGKLTVCTNLSYKPFEYKDDSGKVVGFDVDLMDLVAKKLGVTQDIVDIEFQQITSGAAFAAKKCDAGAAAITIKADRQQAAAFSDPYFSATQALLVPATSGVTDLSALKGKLVGVQTDTTGADYANANAAQYGYTVKVFDDFPSSANAVLAGTIGAAINDNGVVYNFSKDNPKTVVGTEFKTNESYGFNMGKDNTALQSVVNAVLASAKSDGTYNTIYKKWFGVDAPK
jgi:polar amino acid transport system substrate-binding protein